MLKKRYFILLLVASFFIPRSFLSVILSENKNEISLVSNLENNKIFVDTYKAQCLKALSFYPELKDVNIEFREAEIGTTLAARPMITSFFNTDYERKYEVIFNNASNCEVPFSDLPEEGQVGILGHELAHILDYETKSFGQLLVTGCFYINAHSIRNYEREIDKVTVERGLGEKLHDAYHYILEESQASLKYKNFKKFTYLEPHEIMEQVQESGIDIGF
ncbi:MAG: hypothetical protein AB8H03_06120 [Saprospiraceae bacterium]